MATIFRKCGFIKVAISRCIPSISEKQLKANKKLLATCNEHDRSSNLLPMNQDSKVPDS
ncbi:hypothetical protein ACWGOQ_0019750 [Aquimarina sp. M1]